MNMRLLVLAILGTAITACSQSTVDHAADGAALLAPFKADLKAALVKGMETGPVGAIDACKSEAPRISASLSVDGVLMGRSSHKLRNPDNAGPDWLAPLIDDYASGSADRAPQTVSLGRGRMGYAEPIMVQPLCLNCHGESLKPEVATKIAELYPDDQATGFKEGDFRGVWWVEFPGK